MRYVVMIGFLGEDEHIEFSDGIDGSARWLWVVGAPAYGYDFLNNAKACITVDVHSMYLINNFGQSHLTAVHKVHPEAVKQEERLDPQIFSRIGTT
ncbi:hypothetical protein Ccrd_026756 [Cynara cardunculus var. scolymus]|uniref:Uncharacterized protein n=1 Tax=Cynara cardunculus var. scolymus TaxID=59895 RepID=A0A118FSR2_CYNCS|nr:hypothetical protein Ccrd_026756 [Cynara cardunculus var. scolymus]